MKRLLASGICIVAFMLTSGAFAQDDGFRDGQPNFLHPRNGSSISEREVVSVLYTDGCGANELNPDIAPIVRRESSRIIVELTIRLSSTLPFCFAAPPPKEWVIPLGRLPKGNYEIERRVYQPAASGAERPLLSQLLNTVRVGDTPHPSISGTWFDPSAPGSGYVLTLIPDATSAEPQAMMFSAALDGSRKTFWQVGIGRFTNASLAVTGATGGVATAPQDLLFSYLGCGRATIAEVAFPTFFTELTQLTTVAGIETCEAPGQVLQPMSPLDIRLQP